MERLSPGRVGTPRGTAHDRMLPARGRSVHPAGRLPVQPWHVKHIAGWSNVYRSYAFDPQPRPWEQVEGVTVFGSVAGSHGWLIF